MKTAFVTGGTGFLGINLIKALCEQGWSVTALHRASSNLTYIKDLPIKLVEGSITDKASLEKAMPEGIDVAFHLAGDTNMWSKNNAQQTAINVDGSRNMIEVAADKDVSTFIHTSSISAWGLISDDVDESTPQLGGDSWINYEKTKWQGEQEVKNGMAKGVKVVIINPGAIVGPYDLNTWGRLFFALRDNKLPGIPPGTNTIVHVDDVVQAHILAVEKGTNGENYILSGENTSMKSMITEIAKQMDIAKIPSSIQFFAIRIISFFTTFFANFTGKEPLITPEIASLMTRERYRFSNAKALREFGFTMTPWRQGIKENYEWLKKEGLL